MRSKIMVVATLLLGYTLTISAQTPHGFNYQAVARNSQGVLLVSANLIVETGILSDTVANTYLWKEEHDVTTSSFGVFNLVVGQGTKTGGSAPFFKDIGWSAGERYIRTRIKHLGIWHDMGASRLWSVPYAAMAEKAGSLNGDPVKLTVTGDDVSSEESLFEVKRKDGEVIFAVYNHGVRVNVPVDTLTKARKGGFAIGGFDKTKGYVQDYLLINNDSIRIYFDDNPAIKGPKGGFAIGGFDQAKGISQDFLTVNKDSVRIYVDETPGKGPKGGFAIGGFDQTKGAGVPFVHLRPENYFIGHESGESITDGLYNSFLGYQAGKQTTSGSRNIFIGYQSGFSNTVGESNTFVGYQAGYNNLGNTSPGVFQHGFYNCYFGYQAGYESTYGDFNTMIGYMAGKKNKASLNTFIGYSSGTNNIDGSYNTFVGLSSGVLNQTGSGNIFIGHQAGHSNVDGGNNTFIGAMSGAGIKSGNNNVALGRGALAGSVYGATGTGESNVIIGHMAGHDNINGSFNVLIGAEAGNYLPQGTSNQLVIENSSSSTPLISGDFTLNQTKINGGLDVTGTITTPSDIRLKKNITEIEGAVELLSAIRAVHYEWNSEAQLIGVFDEGIQTGVIAQELLGTLPFLVKRDEKGYLSVDYQKLSVIQLAALKEQQREIDASRSRISDLESRLEALEVLLKDQSGK